MPERHKKFLFLVQGEGRGHMTQAIALYQLLKDRGHTITRILIGKSQRRVIPAYFKNAFDTSVEIEPLYSPNFITDPDNKSIRLIRSVIYNIKFLFRYNRSLKRIHTVVKQEKPDILINFYDFLGGFYFLFYKPPLKYLAVGHQFLSGHPDFEFAKEKPIDRLLYRVNNWLTSLKANKKLALSFRSYPPGKPDNLTVIPPLLRKEIQYQVPATENFILGYMVNDGYGEEIIEWHKKNREEVIHCFWDRKGVPDVKVFHKNLTFHQLNAEKFLEMMARCKCLVTTAGFESICEAMYFGKPVLMVPVKGQYEQACNAIDAARAGAGIYDDHFNISRLLEFIPAYKDISHEFKQWISELPVLLEKELVDHVKR